jgi:hypothetical protein
MSSLEGKIFEISQVPSRRAFSVSWMARTAAWKGWWPCNDTRTPLPARYARSPRMEPPPRMMRIVHDAPL